VDRTPRVALAHLNALQNTTITTQTGRSPDMKLITFDEGRVGRLEDQDVIELDVPSTRAYFELEGKVGETGERLKLDSVRLRAPIQPKKFFHTAGNFAEHHKELQAVKWSHPVHKGIVFFQNVDAIIGPDDPIIYPEHLTKELDYELELAIVIGKSGKFFGPDEAHEYIAGFTVFNDITARDIQRREMESGVFSFSKAIDTFCPIGPYIVTADEIDDYQNLAMQLRVNGDVRQIGNTNTMRVSIPHLVAYHSPQVYSAGDLLTTGTISGVAAIQPNPFDFYLQPGDVVEAEIEGVGTLRNRVITWKEGHGGPAPTRVDW
jgi:2-keto-4-pentenoate hydratase/2-oxohepta-3-ene-1,7-dioic acid hydratase in catechol pathway